MYSHKTLFNRNVGDNLDWITLYHFEATPGSFDE